MFTARRKIQKDKDVEPTEFEESVAQSFFDLENSNAAELKSELKDLYINSAVQVDVSGNRKAVVIHVPFRLRKSFRKIHVKLVRKLEKRFSGKDVIVIASRRIVRPPKKGSAVQRPRNRTLTSVHDAVLEDVVYPAEIVGKRIKYRLDGTKLMKELAGIIKLSVFSSFSLFECRKVISRSPEPGNEEFIGLDDNKYIGDVYAYVIIMLLLYISNPSRMFEGLGGHIPKNKTILLLVC